MDLQVTDSNDAATFQCNRSIRFISDHRFEFRILAVIIWVQIVCLSIPDYFLLFADEPSSHVSVPAKSTETRLSTFGILENPARNSGNVWAADYAKQIVATIDEIDSKVIAFRRENSAIVERLASDQVTFVEMSWATELAKSADRESLNGNLTKCIEAGRQAIASGELPRWQQRFVVASMIDAMMEAKQYSSAIKLFSALLKEQPPQLLLASIPVPWQPTKVDLSLTPLCEELVDEAKSPLEQLVGAAWMIAIAESQGSKATGINNERTDKILMRLGNDKLPTVARLSRCLRWRLANPKTFESQSNKWVLERDQLPIYLQLGPTMLLIDRFHRAGDPMRAFEEALRAGTVYTRPRYQRRQAIEYASEKMKNEGRSAESDALRKLLERSKD